MAVLGVSAPYALVKSVFKHALRFTVCSCTLILSSEPCWLVSSHVMYYTVRCGCRVSQFSMFLTWKWVGFATKYDPTFPFQHFLVNVIVPSLLKLVFRVNKGKKAIYFLLAIYWEWLISVQLFFFPRPEDYFSSVEKALSISLHLGPGGDSTFSKGNGSLRLIPRAQLGLGNLRILSWSEHCFWRALLLYRAVCCLLHYSGIASSSRAWRSVDSYLGELGMWNDTPNQVRKYRNISLPPSVHHS